MRKIFYFIIPLCVVVPIMVFGQTNTATDPEQGDIMEQELEPITPASVSIENLKYSYTDITKQILVNFDFVNNEAAIPDVNYSLSIVSDNGTEKDYVYSKNVYLAKDSKTSLSINEIVPDYFFGNITLLLQAKTSSGIPLGVRIRKGVTIKPSSNGPYLDSRSCYLTIASSTKFNLTQGVDMDPTEQLTLNCNVINTSNSIYTFGANMKTYERSISGPVVGESNLPQVSIKGATSTIKIQVPVPTRPQAYTSVISLTNIDKPIGEVAFHYVIRGESGTASLVQMDKMSYMAGDIARAKILWSPRADSFPGTRATSTISAGSLIGKLLLMKGNKACADPVSFSPSKTADQNIEIVIPINIDCNGFETKVEIKDATTNSSLAGVSYKTPTENIPPKSNWLQYTIALSVLLFVLAILVVIIVLLRRRKKLIDSIFVSVILLILASFMSIKDVRAYLFTALFMSDGSSVYVTFFGDFEILDTNGSAASSFNLGEVVTIQDYTSKSFLRCANTWAYDSVYATITVKKTGGSTVTLRDYTSDCDYTGDYCYRSLEWTPTSVGTYTITVTFKALELNSVAFSNVYSYSKTITVIDPRQLNMSFTGTGASRGSVALTNTTQSSCIGPSPCYLVAPLNSVVGVTNAVTKLTSLNTNNVTCAISSTSVYYMATYTGSISGGKAPYTYTLKNVMYNGSPISYAVSYIPSSTSFVKNRFDASYSYLEVSSSDGQMSQVSCGGANVPNLTRGYTQFTGWGGSCSGTGSCSVTMSANKSVSAGYDWVPLTLNHNPAAPVVSAVSTCSDITGNMPVRFSIVMSDPDSDQVQLYEDKGYPAYFQPYGSLQNSGSSITYSKSFTSIGLKTINLRVNDANGAYSTTYSTTTTIVAKCAPVVTLTAYPISIVTNASSSLSWSSVNATACVTSGDWPSPQTSTTSANLTGGKLSTGILSASKTYSYSMSCTGTGGKSATSTVTVVASNVTPLTVACSAAPTTVPSTGADVTFTATITGSDAGTSPYYWNNLQTSNASNAFSSVISSYQNGTTTPPSFTVKDSTGIQRFGSVACAAVPLAAVILLDCHVYANDGEGIVTVDPGSISVSWSSTNAVSCDDPAGAHYSNNIGNDYDLDAGEQRVFTLSCQNPAATPTTCSKSVTVNVTGGSSNAVLWFDSQFPNATAAPSPANASAKALSVSEGVKVKIKSSWNAGTIESCKGSIESGPNIGSWNDVQLDNLGNAIELSNLTLGTYKLKMSCLGPKPADGPALSYTSDNVIRLIVSKSILKEN